MTNNMKIATAIEILKSEGAKGQFKARVSELNSNVVEMFSESGYYCSINVRSGKVMGA